MQKTDDVLDKMALELRTVLIQHGLNPNNPPSGKMPVTKAWKEYLRLGGNEYETADEFGQALLKRVKEVK